MQDHSVYWQQLLPVGFPLELTCALFESDVLGYTNNFFFFERSSGR
jgi:hypothetical protein